MEEELTDEEFEKAFPDLITDRPIFESETKIIFHRLPVEPYLIVDLSWDLAFVPVPADGFRYQEAAVQETLYGPRLKADGLSWSLIRVPVLGNDDMWRNNIPLEIHLLALDEPSPDAPLLTTLHLAEEDESQQGLCIVSEGGLNVQDYPIFSSTGWVTLFGGPTSSKLYIKESWFPTGKTEEEWEAWRHFRTDLKQELVPLPWKEPYEEWPAHSYHHSEWQ